MIDACIVQRNFNDKAIWVVDLRLLAEISCARLLWTGTASRILWLPRAPFDGESRRLRSRFFRGSGQAWPGLGEVDRGDGGVVRCEEGFFDL